MDFFGADVVVASPLGLATKLEEGPAAADALSSIELVVVDGADVMEMQNWAHVQAVFAALNNMPKEQRPDTNFMRIRPWYATPQPPCTILTHAPLPAPPVPCSAARAVPVPGSREERRFSLAGT